MAKEEMKAPEQPKKLDYNQLVAYAQQLEERLKFSGKKLKEMEDQLLFYQMQDYYQRAQLLCMVCANDKLGQDFRDQCEAELHSLVFPPQKEETAEVKQ